MTGVLYMAELFAMRLSLGSGSDQVRFYTASNQSGWQPLCNRNFLMFITYYTDTGRVKGFSQAEENAIASARASNVNYISR